MRLRADQQLFLSYLLLVSLLVLTLSFGADALLRPHLLRTVEDDLRRELALARALHEAAPELPADSAARMLAAVSGRRVTLVAPDGTVLGESAATIGGTPAMENHRTRPEIQAALRGGAGAAVRRSETLGTEHLYVARRTAGGEVLRLAVPLVEIDRALAGVKRGILGVGAGALVLAAMLSFGFSVVVTRPLRRMQAAARALAAGDLSRRLRERRGDELGDLARALDTLADELQGRMAQLEGERAETQALIDAMAEGVLALSPGGALRRANPAARRMFALGDRAAGIPPEAVARRPEFLRLVRRVLAGESVPPVEVASDGRSLLGTAHPLPDGGAVLVFLDVSELRRLEGVRRDFVANASHELKTPLTAIRGYSETLLDPGLTPELARRFAEIVKANADRLQRIVDDLLDLSRIEAGRWHVEPEVTEVAEVAGEAWSAQAERAGKEVRLELSLAEGAECAYGDAAALHQIFTNLFSNALRYTPAGGAVSVRARCLPPPRPAAPSAAGWVEVEVSDTGSGIPAAHLPRIFERFYRVDPARSREEGGTGLGLAIVKHLVEAHGGRIEAESEVGVGTTVRFTLPAVERP